MALGRIYPMDIGIEQNFHHSIIPFLRLLEILRRIHKIHNRTHQILNFLRRHN